MLTRLLTTTAAVLVLAGPAFAQTTESPDTSQPPAAAPSDPAAQPQAEPADQAPAAGEEPAAAAPPPADKVIAEQEESQIRSEELIGMAVMNPAGEDVGQIDSLIFDEEGSIVGAVVSVGGFLGIGAKNVALSWNEFQMRQEEDVAVISLTKAQLEAAPSFKTLEEKEAEREQQMMQQQQGTPGTSPGGSSGGAVQ